MVVLNFGSYVNLSYNPSADPAKAVRVVLCASAGAQDGRKLVIVRFGDFIAKLREVVELARDDAAAPRLRDLKLKGAVSRAELTALLAALTHALPLTPGLRTVVIKKLRLPDRASLDEFIALMQAHLPASARLDCGKKARWTGVSSVDTHTLTHALAHLVADAPSADAPAAAAADAHPATAAEGRFKMKLKLSSYLQSASEGVPVLTHTHTHAHTHTHEQVMDVVGRATSIKVRGPITAAAARAFSEIVSADTCGRIHVCIVCDIELSHTHTHTHEGAKPPHAMLAEYAVDWLQRAPAGATFAVYNKPNSARFTRETARVPDVVAAIEGAAVS